MIRYNYSEHNIVLSIYTTLGKIGDTRMPLRPGIMFVFIYYQNNYFIKMMFHISFKINYY